MNYSMTIEKFVKERKEALLSCDEEQIKRYCAKYNVSMPSNKYAFYLGLEKAVNAITGISESKRNKAVKWCVKMQGKYKAVT